MRPWAVAERRDGLGNPRVELVIIAVLPVAHFAPVVGALLILLLGELLQRLGCAHAQHHQRGHRPGAFSGDGVVVFRRRQRLLTLRAPLPRLPIERGLVGVPAPSAGRPESTSRRTGHEGWGRRQPPILRFSPEAVHPYPSPLPDGVSPPGEAVDRVSPAEQIPVGAARSHTAGVRPVAQRQQPPLALGGRGGHVPCGMAISSLRGVLVHRPLHRAEPPPVFE
mmetsp:Transcript_56778/g.169529  ORF Transcript_56778/g.169529 Transcript_56778/m.169529 type:complete len:223 (-) Transcript_56778:430-1098(-)